MTGAPTAPVPAGGQGAAHRPPVGCGSPVPPSRPAPRTLRQSLAAAGPRAEAALLWPGGMLRLATALTTTVLGPCRADLADRSVMLVVGTQAAAVAVAAMLDLDGLCRRMMVCPPDLNPGYYADVVADAAIEVIVTDQDESAFTGLPSVTVHRCDHPAAPLAQGDVPARGTEWVLSTSGTSGAPKLVVYSLDALTAAIAPVDPARPLVWGTFYDIRRYGGLQIVLRAVLAGCTLVLSSPDEPLVDHLRRLGQAGVTHLSGTPSHWRRLLMSAAVHTIDPATIRLSGEIADQAVLDGLVEAFPRAAIGHAYASTEAGVGFEVNDGREGFPAAFLQRTEPCALRVVDGALQLRSARAASRYLGEAPPALLDPDGFVDSGDMVEQRDDRLYFVGRRGGIINVGGLKVHPEEIEAVINRQACVRMSLVKSRRSPIMGAVVVAEIVLQPGADPERARGEVLLACRAALPVHKVPAVIRVVPALDVTAAGKLARSAA